MYARSFLAPLSIYTCKSTKRLGSTPGKKTWKGYDWAAAILQDLQKGDWGVPVVWISDRDKRFVEGFWKGLFTALRTKVMYTAAYHPSADGQSERSNQTAEIWLRHWQNLHQDTDWDDGLAPMQASLNASTNVSTGESPHKIMYGIALRMPWNLLRDAFVGSPQANRQDADECAKYAAMVMKRQYDNRHKPIFFNVGDYVYLRLARGAEPGYVLPSRTVRCFMSTRKPSFPIASIPSRSLAVKSSTRCASTEIFAVLCSPKKNEAQKKSIKLFIDAANGDRFRLCTRVQAAALRENWNTLKSGRVSRWAG
ncbi:Integrase, catalytic core [Penicillium griseofulvum]|uniref:Integrase, catalytic core n=1 Tax=Penicillium patulum TaxID=5078 RepID=A0A135LZM1_PENPA|nr:Integrase, catalytic core [Penicillium griseofulvum]KXG54375.1 Integrase, catalytic core [Penicillium griseofulvum]